MPKLSQVISTLLGDIALARAETDRISARLGDEYSQDSILQFFPIPRIEIKDFSLELKFAVESMGKTTGESEVIIESEKLKELEETKISTITFNSKVKNYIWSKTNLDRKDDKKLLETD